MAILVTSSKNPRHRYLAPFSTASRIRMVNAASEVPDLIFDVGHLADLAVGTNARHPFFVENAMGEMAVE